jgi:hypothetical protein
MPLYIDDAGTKRKVKDAWVNNGGTWTRLKNIYTNEGGTWVKSFSPEVKLDYIVVGGGGSGGGGRSDSVGGGGGGAGGGGVFASFATVDPTNFSVSVSIGMGAQSAATSVVGNNGSPSTLTGSLSALAGGGFGGARPNGSSGSGPTEVGGGGGLPNGSAQSSKPGQGIYNGIGAGGGGAGDDDSAGDIGGSGFVWPINQTTYSGGGGGGGEGAGEGPTAQYIGGAGGGGQGGRSSERGFNATFYGGGGGGGGGNNSSSLNPISSGAGYPGIAIFSYVWPQQLFTGGLINSQTTNGVTRWFHTFYTAGTFSGI